MLKTSSDIKQFGNYPMGVQRVCSQGICKQGKSFLKKKNSRDKGSVLKLVTLLPSEVTDFVTRSEIFILKRVLFFMLSCLVVFKSAYCF